ncbi:MAG: transcription-repair coupling factor [Candidatus Anammoxibacter sp.]
MKDLFEILSKSSTYKQIKKHLIANRMCNVNGLWGSSWAFFISTIAFDLQKSQSSTLTVLLVTDSVIEAEESIEDINLFLPDCTVLLPPLETINDFNICDDYSQNVSLIDRTNVLHQIMIAKKAEGGKGAKRINFITASVQALMQYMPEPKTISSNTLTINVGKECKHEKLTRWLTDRGFARVTIVESPGEFSLKGCIMDVYPYSSNEPHRIEFFGDEVTSIRVFDTETQISKGEIESCQILALKRDTNPAQTNKPAGNAKSATNNQQSTIFSYLPEDTLIALKDETEIFDKARTLIPEKGMENLTLSYNALETNLKKFKNICISATQIHADLESISTLTKNNAKENTAKNGFSFDVKSLEEFSLGLDSAIKKLNDICTSNKRTIVFCNNEAEIHRFKELLKDREPQKSTLKDSLQLKIGHINKGFQINRPGISLLSYNEVFKRYGQKRAPKEAVKTKPIDSFLDLKKGDLVVHTAHGIARFLGIKELDATDTKDASKKNQLDITNNVKENSQSSIRNLQSETRNREGRKREYLYLEFAEGTMVYVPATNIDLVQKYIGPSSHKPYLSKIGGKTWDKRKEQAQNAINDMANELISLQAVRGSIPGISCKKEDEWQKEFEAAFIYQETEDQLIVANDIKKDLEAPMPMDRLVCGDVGYGKTELAMRAAFKVVMNGRQVAVLVPTTILAQQHYRTFTERMADYPIKIGLLSRFRTKKEQKVTLEMAAAGTVDIVIGTHRLVQKDVHFKNIGLVVIDEEQKFGVEHKERLKKLRHVVDVLTLTATPIPRTLHMAMLGLRDISSLNTPPLDRKSIQTQIIRFDPELIRQIIIHELNRNGQIFFVHNRVYNIEAIASMIGKLVPEAKIVVGHGQMTEKLLEQRMLAFVEGKADILVSTTIIESGLDIPNVNTILINDADTFGLADLHQLRGRVGRYKHRAYAYLIVPSGRPITPEAEKKLKAIEEFSGLGAGFKIALRDLEVRGAGNFIGSQQHGHLAAIGYEMYCRLLESTVKRLKKQPVPVQINVSINIGLDAYLPNDYISNHSLKMEIYRKLNRLQHVNEVNDLALLIKDRFGSPPDPVRNLLIEAEVRIAAFRSTVRSLSKVNGMIVIELLDFKKAEKTLNPIKESLRFINSETIHLRPKVNIVTPEETLMFLRSVFIGNKRKLKF